MRELRTKRLFLRHVKCEDAQRIFDCWASDPEVTRYLSWNPHETVEATKGVVSAWVEEYKKDDCYRYGIEVDGELVGMIGVVGYFHGNPVIEYCLGRAYWGNGYMTEALGAVTRELFEEGYDTIVIEAVKANIASNRVIQKSGFTLLGGYENKLSDLKPEPVTINTYRLYRKNG